MPGKEDRIRARAYELWEREGRVHGSHDRHWVEASRQVEAEMGAELAAAVQPAGKAPARKSARSANSAKTATADKPAARVRKPKAPKPA